MKVLKKIKIGDKEFIIRYLDKKDARGIFEIKNSLYREKAMTGMNEKPEFKQTRESVLRSSKNIENKNWVDLVLEYENKIVGRAFIRKIDDPCQSHVASFGIHLINSVRGSGASQKFFEVVEKEAKKILKIKIITLGVMSCNKRAIKFYLRNKFKKTGLVKGAIKYFNRFEDEVLMAKYYK